MRVEFQEIRPRHERVEVREQRGITGLAWVEAVRMRVQRVRLSGRRSDNNDERQRENNPHSTHNAPRSGAVKHDHRHAANCDRPGHLSTDRKRIQPLPHEGKLRLAFMSVGERFKSRVRKQLNVEFCWAGA